MFDLDGTLAESKQPITEEMGNLCAKMLNRGTIAVISGAAFPQFEKEFLSVLPKESNLKNLYIFPVNAAQCYSYQNNSWQKKYDYSLNDDEKKLINKVIEETLTEMQIDTEMEIWGKRADDRGAQITFSALGQEAPLEAKREWNIKYNEQRAKMRDALANRLPQFSVSSGGLTSIDITKKGITKAFGVTQMALIANTSVSEMLYIGDALEPGGNDSVVKETGIKTIQVTSPKETAEIMSKILKG